MKRHLFFAGAVILLVLGACASNQAIDMHNSRDSLNWDGVYTGVTPAADGPGIEVTIKLNTDLTYSLSYHYIDRPKDGDFTVSGKFTWDKSGSVIKLDDKEVPPYYRVGENLLIQLDMQGKPITGMLADLYILKKTP